MALSAPRPRSPQEAAPVLTERTHAPHGTQGLGGARIYASFERCQVSRKGGGRTRRKALPQESGTPESGGRAGEASDDDRLGTVMRQSPWGQMSATETRSASSLGRGLSAARCMQTSRGVRTGRELGTPG